MRGPKFVLVLVFGILGFNVSSAQIFLTELFPTQKDSLYDYQIYQKYYWWAYYPGLCGYSWSFPPLNGPLLNSQLSTLGYYPRLNYFNCPCEDSYYLVGFNDFLHWQNKRDGYLYGRRNNGSSKNKVLLITINSEQKKNNSINRVETDLANNHNQVLSRANPIDKKITAVENSKISHSHNEKLLEESALQLHQLSLKQEFEQNKNQDINYIEPKPTQIEPGNYKSISEKIQNDIQLSSWVKKVYSVDKPKRHNVWKYFQTKYYHSQQDYQHQNTGGSYNYNNNTQRSHFSESGNNSQRNNSTQKSSRTHSVSNSKTKVAK